MSSTVLSRTSELLNNIHFSDVVFQVKDLSSSNPKECKFYAHKLILSMASPYFEKAFYESHAKKPENSIKVNASPEMFHRMLQFIYTDKINVQCIEDAFLLYELGKKYKIKLLEEYCGRIISDINFNIESFFELYEKAVLKNIVILHSKCIEFLCENAKEILKSNFFLCASESVVIDIVRQDYLKVDTELDVINAVIRWGENMCKQKNLPSKKYLRAEIHTLLKNVRFLTLSIEDFYDFVVNHDIFTEIETEVIRRNILGITDITLNDISRNKRHRNNDQHLDLDSYPATVSSQTQFSSIKMDITESQNSYDHPTDANINFKTLHPPLTAESSLKQTKPMSRNSNNVNSNFSSLTSTVNAQMQPSTRKFIVAPSQIQNFEDNKISNSRTYHQPGAESPLANISAQNHSLPTPKSHLMTFISKRRNIPLIPALSQPSNFVVPQMFEFPLCDFIDPLSDSELDYHFKRDVISTIEFYSENGQISVQELYIKIKGKEASEEEKLSIFVSPDQGEEDSYQLAVNNGNIHLILKNPVVVPENSKSKITITVDELQLNRCLCLSNSKEFVQNKGRFSMKISANSNRKIGDRCLFFISTIIYCYDRV